jgi:hypothetical protein
MLDQEMLEIVRRVRIARRVTPDANLPVKRGQVVAHELAGRYLLRYMLPHQVGQIREGSPARHFVTPTPYSADDVVAWLYLPKPTGRREFVLLLDPGKIAVIQGPRWVRLGNGIEYILPEGFQREAIVAGWELNMEER